MPLALSDLTVTDIHTPASTMEYLHAPLDFETGFGFSPATSPAKDSSKHEFSGYFSNAFNDAPLFFDQHEGELFNTFSQPSPLLSFPPSSFSTVNAKLIHGQVTPPSDNSPITPKREVDNSPTPVSLDDTTTLPHPSRKRKGAHQNLTPPASAQSAPKRRKISAGRKASDASSAGGDVRDEKRNKFLERNRVAASKCRQKKKEWTANLEQKARDLQSNKTQLSLLVNSLREEVLYLKSEVLRHESCNCTALRNYMSRSVSQITGEPPTSGKLQLPADASPVSDLDLDGMSFNGSPQLKATGGSPTMKPASPL